MNTEDANSIKGDERCAMDKRITKRIRRQRAVTIAQEFLAAAMLWLAVILLFILAG